MKYPFPQLKSKAILSPMAGVTDVAFRALAAKYGAGLTCTEFVSGTAIVRGAKGTLDMLQTSPNEKQVAVQLFGSSIVDVVAAGKLMQDRFDIIDVNCGCPAWKVIKTGAGSEMLRDPQKISDFIRQLVAGVDRPVTVKIRIGIDDNHINAVEVAKLVEAAGASAIAIHGRTQKQGYSGKANWDVIRDVKRAVKIPVIGNGDVFTPEDFKRRLDESGVDAVMIARGAIGNPAIFAQIREYMETGSYRKHDPISQFFEYLEFAKQYDVPFSVVKNQAIYFTKGIVGGARVRQALATMKSVDELEKLLINYRK